MNILAVPAPPRTPMRAGVGSSEGEKSDAEKTRHEVINPTVFRTEDLQEITHVHYRGRADCIG